MKPQSSGEIFRYHEETKHHVHRFARSPGYMDWNNQPIPFRFYTGPPPVSLPFLHTDPATDYRDLYVCNSRPARPFDLNHVAGFFELSMGISAWKETAGSRWSLRINPSSGNLHPTEAYLLTPPLGAVTAGVYHYNPYLHALEPRTAISSSLWSIIRAHFATDGFLVGLASIFWRESWKYGERAYRYCNHDVGHALAALRFAANLFGWKIKYLNALSDGEIETILGLNKTEYPTLEEEHPDLLCLVYPHRTEKVPLNLDDQILSAFDSLDFQGEPNHLSQAPVRWDLIDQVAASARKPATAERRFPAMPTDFLETPPSSISAIEIVRNRRSAVAFDPQGSISKKAFLAMLDKTLPRTDIAPFDIELMRPSIDLMIFIHAVEDLQQGLYWFSRCGHLFDELKNMLRPDFLWRPIADNMNLYLLELKNFRTDARIISCDQEIAGASAFSLGMIAQFSEIVLREPYRYRHLFWEAGMIGQVLYLEAEAQGFRGTGIGCYFDDEVHELIGLKDNRYQSLYHFTVGRPVEDPRLKTFPPYHHLKGRLSGRI